MQGQRGVNIVRMLRVDFLECGAVVRSLVSAACVVSVCLLWGAIGQPEEAAVTVEIASIPALEHLRPPTDLARVTLTALLHGTPLRQGHMQVQLTAPPRTTLLATDDPGVAGTPLLAFDSDVIDGRVSLQYRFPLRGPYTFDLELTPVPGGPVFPPTRQRQTVHIAEHPTIMRHPWLLIASLFLLGKAMHTGRLGKCSIRHSPRDASGAVISGVWKGC